VDTSFPKQNADELVHLDIQQTKSHTQRGCMLIFQQDILIADEEELQKTPSSAEPKRTSPAAMARILWPGGCQRFGMKTQDVWAAANCLSPSSGLARESNTSPLAVRRTTCL
jgi:hypothetical protein